MDGAEAEWDVALSRSSSGCALGSEGPDEAGEVLVTESCSMRLPDVRIAEPSGLERRDIGHLNA